MSENAQAAAMSKAVIQLIDNFDKSLLAVNRQLPPMAAMWMPSKPRFARSSTRLTQAPTQHKLSIW